MIHNWMEVDADEPVQPRGKVITDWGNDDVDEDETNYKSDTWGNSNNNSGAKWGGTSKKEEDTFGGVKKERTNECFICKKEGHRANECPEKKSNLCYNCNKEGHRANECPEEKKQKKGCFQCGGDHRKAECPQLNGGGGGNSGGGSNWGQTNQNNSREAPANFSGWGSATY